MTLPQKTQQDDQILHIPAAQLLPSSLNVRKSGGQSISELAASIRSNGLLQNLTVIPRKGKGKVTHEIVAGNRRFRAIQQLIADGALPADYAVMCRLTSADRAVASSLAENVVREAMHPADQVLAFKALADEGKSASEIADGFGVAEVTVQRRLRLASVAPELLDEYRAGTIKAEQLQALSLTDDHAVQIEVWEKCHDWTSANAIKGMIAQDEVSSEDDARAAFVGIDAYVAAGGGVRRDLFSDEGEFFLSDAGLLERLAQERLKAVAEKLQQDEKLPWVDAVCHFGYSERAAYRKCQTSTRDPSGSEDFRLKKLRREMEKLCKEQERLQEEGEHDQSDALERQRLSLEADIDDMESRLQFTTGPDSARAGAVVTIAEDGRPEIRRHLLRKTEDQNPRATADDDEDDEEGDDQGDGYPEEVAASTEPKLPSKLVERLTAHKTVATQAVMAGDPHAALCVLTHQLIRQTFYHGWGGPLDLRGPSVDLGKYGQDVIDSRAVARLQRIKDTVLELLPDEGCGDALELLKWLLDQPQETVLQVMAFCTSLCLDLVRSAPAAENEGDIVPQAMGIDMSFWWQPTRATYFDHVPKTVTEATVQEVGGDVQALAAMKKDAAAARAEEMLAGKNWLPAVLRGDA